jgi:hypothetical protein
MMLKNSSNKTTKACYSCDEIESFRDIFETISRMSFANFTLTFAFQCDRGFIYTEWMDMSSECCANVVRIPCEISHIILKYYAGISPDYIMMPFCNLFCMIANFWTCEICARFMQESQDSYNKRMKKKTSQTKINAYLNFNGQTTP